MGGIKKGHQTLSLCLSIGYKEEVKSLMKISMNTVYLYTLLVKFVLPLLYTLKYISVSVNHR